MRRPCGWRGRASSNGPAAASTRARSRGASCWASRAGTADGNYATRRIAPPSNRPPPYPLGCKRIIYANDYYPTLAQPHVALVTDGIARITADGIVTTDGREHRLDALVCATGFETVNLLESITITGCAGRTLAEAWRDGPVALHGIGVAGFPNLFLMLGPNTATGHTSTLFYIEAAARHALAVMQRVRERGGRWAAVKPEAMAAHDAALQARLRGSIWTQCRSWYRMEDGRVIAIFPGFTPEYVRKAGTLEPADYHWG
jgi:cation diffusion facilitator CzcD-associated flavoprotein CzcO